MPFWKVSRATGAQLSAGSAALDPAPHLEPLSVYITEGTFDGWIVAAEQRVTDLLNQHPQLRVCLDTAVDRWETIHREIILFVAPPERATNPQRRISRRKGRLVALVGDNGRWPGDPLAPRCSDA